MTACSQSADLFEVQFSRRVVAEFDGGRLTTEGRALWLHEADRKIDLVQRVASCFTDARGAERIEHSLDEMLTQRIYALALGYENLDDHEELRRDPRLALLAGKGEIQEPHGAGAGRFATGQALSPDRLVGGSPR